MGKKWNTLPGAPVPMGTKGSLEGGARAGGDERAPKLGGGTEPRVARPGRSEGSPSLSGSPTGNARPGGAQKLG